MVPREQVLRCTRRAGVNGRLIGWLASAADRPALQAQIAEVLQVTGAFSISGALSCHCGWLLQRSAVKQP